MILIVFMITMAGLKTAENETSSRGHMKNSQKILWKQESIDLLLR